LDEANIIFKKAIETLNDAEFSFNHERYNLSINRSYYAVFYATKALLLKKEVPTKTYKGLIHQFGLEYVVNNDFDEKIAKKLSELEEDRCKVDCEFDFDLAEKRKVKTDLEDAKIFIEECKKFI
jgi:uncharacterized protein (UPF0332 family)